MRERSTRAAGQGFSLITTMVGLVMMSLVGLALLSTRKIVHTGSASARAKATMIALESTLLRAFDDPANFRATDHADKSKTLDALQTALQSGAFTGALNIVDHESGLLLAIATAGDRNTRPTGPEKYYTIDGDTCGGFDQQSCAIGVRVGLGTSGTPAGVSYATWFFAYQIRLDPASSSANGISAPMGLSTGTGSQVFKPSDYRYPLTPDHYAKVDLTDYDGDQSYDGASEVGKKLALRGVSRDSGLADHWEKPGTPEACGPGQVAQSLIASGGKIQFKCKTLSKIECDPDFVLSSISGPNLDSDAAGGVTAAKCVFRFASRIRMQSPSSTAISVNGTATLNNVCYNNVTVRYSPQAESFSCENAHVISGSEGLCTGNDQNGNPLTPVAPTIGPISTIKSVSVLDANSQIQCRVSAHPTCPTGYPTNPTTSPKFEVTIRAAASGNNSACVLIQPTPDVRAATFQP